MGVVDGARLASTVQYLQVCSRLFHEVSDTQQQFAFLNLDELSELKHRG